MAASAKRGPNWRRRWLVGMGVALVLLGVGAWVQHRTALPLGQWRVVGVRDAEGGPDVSGVGARVTVSRAGLMVFDGVNDCTISAARLGPWLSAGDGPCTAEGWAGPADAPTPRTAAALATTCRTGTAWVRRAGDTVQLQRDGVVVTLAR